MNVPFNFLTDEERQALSVEDFGDPTRRLFPVLTQEDVDKAPHRITVLPNLDEVKTRIMAIAARKGFTLPEAWKVGEVKTEVATASTGFSAEANINKADSFAEFELDASTVKDTSDGEYVLRTGKIFEAGQYKDKNFEISSEELCDAIADFEPVDLDLEHMPTILDGKLGRLEAVALAADGKSLIGTVSLPKWLDRQLGEAERKVSATWDRITKKLTKLALVRNPRVKDAAIYAAFMANEFSDTLEGATEADFAQTIEGLIEEHFGKKTWDGMALMQGIHDMAARTGAICMENEQQFNEAKDAGFISEAESKAIQQIHNTALRGGAICSFAKEGSGIASSDYNIKENKNMTIDDVKKFFQSMPDEGVAAKTTTTELSANEKIAEIKLAAEKAATDAVTAARLQWEKEAALKAEEEAKAKVEAAEEAIEEALVENSTVEPTEREKQLETELAALRAREIQNDAEKFADGEIRAERAYPAERETMVALFKQAFIDDNISEATIVFNSGETEVQANRVETIKALYSVRKPHNLTYEEVEDFSANVLATNFDSGEDYLGEAEKQAKAYAAKKKATGKAKY